MSRTTSRALWAWLCVLAFLAWLSLGIDSVDQSGPVSDGACHVVIDQTCQ